MTATRISASIDKLVSFFTAALGSTLTVLDGSVPSMSYPTDWMVVGGDGPVDADEEAASSDQDWLGLGARTRMETVTVKCAIGCWTGSTGTTVKRDMRVRAEGFLETAVAAIRTDPGLGGFTTGGAEMTEAELHYTDNTGGIGAAYVFSIAIPIRLPA